MRLSHTEEVAKEKPPTRVLLLLMMPIGDTLFATPTIDAIHARYPGAQVTALVHSATASLASHIPGVDEVLVLPTGPDWRGPRALLRLLWQLRSRRFDAAVDFTSPAYKWINVVAGIPCRGYMKFDRLWWCLPRKHNRWRSRHATRHYYECAQELALPPWDEAQHAMRIHLPRHARVRAQRFLLQHGAHPDGSLIVAIHPGGAGLSGIKRWPAERFSQVADALAERWGARILLLGGKDEAELARAVAARMAHAALTTAGGFSLLATFALIEACDLYIGNDSGLLHAAAALGIPYVGIYGPTSVANFHPVPTHKGQGRIVLPPVSCAEPYYFVGGDPIWKHPCCQDVCKALALIPVEHVLSAADELLERHLTAAAAD